MSEQVAEQFAMSPDKVQLLESEPASPTKSSRPYAARNLDAALGPAPAPFSLDDGPVGFDLPDFAVEA